LKRLAVAIALIASPAASDEAVKSEAGTAFMERCLADVSAHRIATLKRQAPDYAETLSEDDLVAGGMAKAQKACPCFLQIIAVDPETPGAPEDKVTAIVAYLDDVNARPMPQVIGRLTRMCGERSSVLPTDWIGE